MSLDINTKKGQVSLTQEQEMITAIERSYPNFKVIQTPKNKSSDIDGFLCKDNQIFAVIENKCRDLSKETLKGSGFNNEWLVTYEKILKGAQLAKALQVPFVGFLYLLKSKVILSIQITDDNGNIIQNLNVKQSETQANINGGKAFRTNAYINMSNSKEIII